MRACTAVITEVSFNFSERRYRAEVEFITQDDWRKELKLLFQDLLDSNGDVSRDSSNENSDAGVAYAKIKSVYPKKTKEDIAKSSVEAMLSEVAHILGETKEVEEDDCLKFYRQLQRYIDSKEKTSDKDKDKKKKSREMELWVRTSLLLPTTPLIAIKAVDQSRATICQVAGLSHWRRHR